jgi:hypothetical protein
MEEEDIVVLDNEEFLWFWHDAWGDKTPQTNYGYAELQTWLEQN